MSEDTKLTIEEAEFARDNPLNLDLTRALAKQLADVMRENVIIKEAYVDAVAPTRNDAEFLWVFSDEDAFEIYCNQQRIAQFRQREDAAEAVRLHNLNILSNKHSEEK